MPFRTLKQVRRQRLLTIRALAKHAGVSTRTVLQVEHGLRRPHPGTITKLAAALGVEPAEIREFRVVMGLENEEIDQ